MSNLSIYEKVRGVPENAKKKITGGRLNGKTDINPMWRIKTLTEQFGPCGIGWYYKTTRQWLENHGDVTAAFVNIELYIKADGEWSQPIFGTGGSMFAEVERSGVHVSDECFKMATTDAISVACKQLGIGADVYWEADNTKYTSGKTENGNAENVVSKEDRDRLAEVERELLRTGYTAKAVCNKYKVASMYHMTDSQIKDFLKNIKEVKDKAAG